MPTAIPTAAFEIMVILIYKFESSNDEIYKLLIAPSATLEKAASAIKRTELSSRNSILSCAPERPYDAGKLPKVISVSGVFYNFLFY